MNLLIKIYLSIISIFFIYSCSEVATSNNKELQFLNTISQTKIRQNLAPKELFEAASTNLSSFKLSKSLLKGKNSNLANSESKSLIGDPHYELFIRNVETLITHEKTPNKITYNSALFKSLNKKINYLNEIATEGSLIDKDNALKLLAANKDEIIHPNNYPKAPIAIIYNQIAKVRDLIKEGKFKEARELYNTWNERKLLLPQIIKNLNLTLLGETLSLLEKAKIANNKKEKPLPPLPNESNTIPTTSSSRGGKDRNLTL